MKTEEQIRGKIKEIEEHIKCLSGSNGGRYYHRMRIRILEWVLDGGEI